MSENDEKVGTVQVVRLGQKYQPAEVTIFYRPWQGFQVHNGYLAESKRVTNLGKTYQQLTIATSMGKKIIVRRYYGTGEIYCETASHWVQTEIVTL